MQKYTINILCANSRYNIVICFETKNWIDNFQMKYFPKLNQSLNRHWMATMHAFLHMGRQAQERLSQW